MFKLNKIHIILLSFVFLLLSCDDDFIENIEADQLLAASGVWENIGDVPSERCGALAGIYCNSMYVFAGKDYSGYKTDAWKFSIATGKTEFLGTAPYRSFTSLVRVDDTVYIYGGYNQEPESGSIYGSVDRCVLDFENGSANIEEGIATTGEIPSGRYLHTSFLYNNDLYILGGNKTFFIEQMVSLLSFGLDDNIIDFYRFDILNSKWYKIRFDSGPLDRSMHGSAIISSLLYLFGGMDEGSHIIGDMWVCDLETDSWAEINPVGENPGKRAGFSMRELDGRLYLFGGFNENNVFMNDLWCYYPEVNKWKLLSPANNGPSSRAFYNMEIYNNKLLLYSGYSNNDDPLYFSDVWIYTPGKNEQVF